MKIYRFSKFFRLCQELGYMDIGHHFDPNCPSYIYFIERDGNLVKKKVEDEYSSHSSFGQIDKEFGRYYDNSVVSGRYDSCKNIVSAAYRNRTDPYLSSEMEKFPKSWINMILKENFSGARIFWI